LEPPISLGPVVPDQDLTPLAIEVLGSGAKKRRWWVSTS
jgi:hypothetical protein